MDAVIELKQMKRQKVQSKGGRSNQLKLEQIRELAKRKKQKLENAEFKVLWERASSLVSENDLARRTSRTADEIKRYSNGRRSAFAWSGGKDSLVLEHICSLVGLVNSVLVITDLEFRKFLRWATDAMPVGLTVVRRPLDLVWLAEHSDMLFPRNYKTARRWFQLVQHTGQDRYCRDEDIELLLFGRRWADGNYIPNRNGLHKSRGVVRYAPLRGWSHAEIFAYLQHWEISLPPNYFWPRGFRVGTGPWPARQWCRTVNEGWDEIQRIDPAVVVEAAEYIDSARAYLDEK